MIHYVMYALIIHDLLWCIIAVKTQLVTFKLSVNYEHSKSLFVFLLLMLILPCSLSYMLPQ